MKRCSFSSFTRRPLMPAWRDSTSSMTSRTGAPFASTDFSPPGGGRRDVGGGAGRALRLDGLLAAGVGAQDRRDGDGHGHGFLPPVGSYTQTPVARRFIPRDS